MTVQKSGKVREKDKDWGAAKKVLLGNVKGFIEELKGFKALIDTFKVPKVVMVKFGDRINFNISFGEPHQARVCQ